MGIWHHTQYEKLFFFYLLAKFDLGMGAHCDEVNERRYCSEGLVCHKCPNQNDYTCVRCKYWL